ncbi:LPXTG cell wall anchor domain-containing protein [Streptococcus oralis subsp. oralis]|uniref:LPXTG cell wall anchor domain-containing protein n=13 Tax=Streptococcus oralis TaxID=1303 RepID=A0A7H9FFH9_STROR|nr:SpaA isopeptide-forming pilin-related protein [Streptococcus oralis]QLL97215.1 LPXTG cell wall anchor domain-containing protein [Streptococcus oralis subsp. oralis]
MNKKIRSWIQILILCLGVILQSFAPLTQVHATEYNDVITSVGVENKSGEALTQGLDIWQEFRLTADFVLPDNTVHEGDTTTLQLPSEIAFSNSSDIELRDASNNLVATGHLDATSKTITLTYTKFVENNSGVRGKFFVYVRVDHDVVSEEKDIDVNITVGHRVLSAGKIRYNGPPGKYDSKIEKSSFQYKDDEKNVIRYNITVNRNMANYSDVTIKDAFSSPNMTFLPDTFRIYKVNWSWNNGDWKWSDAQDMTETFKNQLVVNANGDGFTLPLGDTNGFGYMIEYRAKANYDLVDGEEITNVANMSYNGSENEQSTSTRTYQIAGGVAEGYVFTIKIHKVNEAGQPLQGAVFEVIRDRNQAVVGRLTTGPDGNASVGKLLRDNYTIREVTAPFGYDKLTEDIKISPDEFGSDKSVERRIENKKTPPKTPTEKEITFKKVDPNGKEIPGAELKIYSGDTVNLEEAPVADWTTVADTSKVIKLAPGTYTLREFDAPEGYQIVGDITFTVNADGSITIKNKGADDTVLAAGPVLTITDKEDTSPKPITFSKVNLGGNEIAGAQIKIYKGEKAEGTAVESWTSTDQPKQLNLEPGIYTFHEEAAPTGYLKVTDITFQVKPNGTVEVTKVGEKDSKGEDNRVVAQNSTLTVTDKDDDVARKITFSKISLGGVEIAGAQIKIFKGDKAEGTAVESWTSEAGKSKELSLAPGTYTFHEEAAPTGYLKVTDITFKVNYDGTVKVTNVGTKDAKGEDNTVVTDGSTIKVTDKDDDSPRKITFSKVSLGGTEIAGAQIKIYKGDKAEGTAVESWTSEAGKSKNLNLAPGTYTFHEEAAPTGYLKVTDITFQVKHDGTVEVTNVGEKDSKGEENKVVTNGSTVTVTDKDDDLPRKITFSKVSLGGTEIAGAQIKIYKGDKAEGTAVESWTSEAGKSKDLNLAPGTYTFHEEAAPTGYLKVTDITFQVKHDGTVEVTNVGEKDSKGEENKVVTNGSTVTVTDKDDDLPRKITFSKVSLGGTEIAGAQIKIYKGDKAEGTAVESWTSEAGKSKDLNLAPGTYTFHEEAAPTGYLKVTDITFQVKHDGTVEVTNVGEKDSKGEENKVVTNGSTVTVTDKDDDLPRKITFSKVSLGGTEIAGAEIKIYKGDKAEGTAVESWTSEAGKSKDLNLAPGTYTFHEEAAPTGYLKVTDITFQVKHDGTVEVTNVGEKDSKGEENKVVTNGSTVTVTDKDDDLPRKITFSKVSLGGTEIAGAQIKIYKGDKAEGTAVESWTSEAGKSKDLNLAPGTYTFHEEAAPTGYLKVTDITFQVKHDGTVEVTNVGEKDSKGEENKVVTNGSTVTVTDKDDDLPRKITFSKVSLGGTEIAGAQIKIYKGDKAEGTAVESWTSEAGKSKDLNLAPGTYTFHEEAAPTGYLKVTDITFQVKHDGTVEVTNVGEKDSKGEENKVVTNGSTVTVTDKDDDLPRKITFSKVSLGGTEIAGAEIKIYKGDKAEGTAVESWTSEAGKSKDLNLAPGTYTFHEEAAPTGYLKVTDITFQVKHDGTVEVTNVGEKDSKGEENKVVTNGSTVTVTDKDDDLPRKITFSKVSLGGTEIAGAQIKIYKGDKAEGTAVESWTSEAGKSKDLNLAPGTYTFHEEAAPTGYLKVTDITFQVKHDGTVEVTNVGEKDSKGEENKVVTNGSTVTVTDKDDDLPRKITFSKVNLAGEEIAGAKIQIFRGEKVAGNPVAEWTSKANQSHVLDLTPGVYTFHEEAAPTGYLKVTDITFQVKHDGTVEVTNVGEKDSKGEENKVVTNGSTVTVTDKDDDLPRKITFSKVNLAGEEIAGAKIQIFRGEKVAGNPVAEWTSKANQSHVLDLTPGVYTFHEEAAPTGYLSVTDITFQVNYDGTVTVVNASGNQVEFKDGKLVVTDQTEPENPNLPNTGSESGQAALAAGLALLALGAGLVATKRRKED